jgi:hypothetical protein
MNRYEISPAITLHDTSVGQSEEILRELKQLRLNKMMIVKPQSGDLNSPYITDRRGQGKMFKDSPEETFWRNTPQNIDEFRQLYKKKLNLL